MRSAFKTAVQGVFLALSLPLAALAAFGRAPVPFLFGAHLTSLVPGLLGDYFRIAYYKLTLERCSLTSRVSFGAFFAHPEVVLGRRVYIGPYCVIGRCSIGDRTQIATQVQILSGSRQHRRDESGAITGSEEGVFEAIAIGSDCWIGAAAIIMAPVGAKTTIGAGSIVTKEIPAGVVAVGNPARVLRESVPA